MKHWHRIFVAAVACIGASSLAPAADATEPKPSPEAVRPGVWLIPGGMQPERQPDGNTVVFEAPSGLIVVDTGRHDWQQRAILDLAHERKQVIAAIINTHWHLDHVSANPVLRKEYPQVRVYASDAIAGALQGFLAKSVREAPTYLADKSIPATLRDDIRADAATVAAGAALRPDTIIEASAPMKIAGRELQLHLARNAATAGDVWLYDARNRLVVTGDLVTLPVPFLDTACPAEWTKALRQVAATNFKLAIPGHGPVLDRAQFVLYQQAFDAFIGCASSSRPAQDCAQAWLDAVRPLLAGSEREHKTALGLGRYYVEMLREHGGRSESCAAPVADD